MTSIHDNNRASDNAGIKSLAVIMACHNRRDTTLSCLRALYSCVLPDGLSMQVYLVDDGSSDGTSDSVRAEFSQVKLIEGNGSLYWNGGMVLAFGEAIKDESDYYLWLNDDTTLYPDAIELLLNCERNYLLLTGSPALVVGSTCDPTGKLTTYGGFVRTNRWNRTKFSLLPASEEVQHCDTINGNCVLVPAQIAIELGNIESSYTHGMGDIDYGLRARQRGYDLLVAPNYVGICKPNIIKGGFTDQSLPFRSRMRNILSEKGLPLKTWFIFTRRHAGVLWPLYFIWPYSRVAVSSLFSMFQRRFSHE